MKRLMYKAAAAALALAFAGCASTKGSNAPVADKNDIDKVTVVDWSGRTLGAKPELNGLLEAQNGNSSKLKQELSLENSRLVSVSEGIGKTLAQAQALSRADLASKKATELSQIVNVQFGNVMDDKGEVDVVSAAVSKTPPTKISGIREEGSFWQKVRTTSAETRESKEEYRYYTIYSMSQESWNTLCDTYLINLKRNGNFKAETQKVLDELFDEIKKDADRRDLEEIQ